MRLPSIRHLETRTGTSLMEASFADLEAIDPKWRIEIGFPVQSPLWIHGMDLVQAKGGAFHTLLLRIGQRLQTSDRKTVAACFALRFGWTSSAAIAPFLLHRCVPDISLPNISLKFREDTFFEQTAIHVARGIVLNAGFEGNDGRTQTVGDETGLLRTLRLVLHAQAGPVVDALYAWSGFSKKGAWGQITSSWASQFINVCDRFGGQTQAQAIVEAFFAGDDILAATQPRLHPITFGDVTHLYQRRASCCRYYLLPEGTLCASCPLVSQEVRVQRNLEWMRRQLYPKNNPARNGSLAGSKSSG